MGNYVLDSSVYYTHLPRKFRHVLSTLSRNGLDYAECVVVNANGQLTVEPQIDSTMNRYPSREHRWSYLPRTMEMEKRCQPLTVKLRLWNEAEGGS